MNLIAITLILATFSFGFNRITTNRTFTPCFFYWSIWLIDLFCMFCTAQFIDIRPLSDQAKSLIIQLHIGAFIGFILADILNFVNKPKLTSKRKSLFLEKYFIPKWLIRIFLLSVIVGILYSAFIIYKYGLDFVAIRKQFIEENYMKSQLPIFSLLSNYSGILLSLIVIIVALKDLQKGKTNYWRLALLTFTALPVILTTGGRGALLNVIPPYTVVILVGTDYYKLQIFRRAYFKFLFLIIPIMMLIISLVYYARSESEDQTSGLSGRNFFVSNLIPTTWYIATPIIAMEGYAQYAQSYNQANPPFLGQTFPFINRQLSRLGLSKNGDEFTSQSRDWVYKNFDIMYGSTHATIIPSLIADFGVEYFWVGMLMLAGLFEFLFLRFSNHGILGAMIIIWTCWYGALNAPTVTLFGSSGPMLQLGFTWIIYRICTKKFKKENNVSLGDG